MGVPQRRCSSCGESYAEGVIFCPRDGTALPARSIDNGPDPYLGQTLRGEFRIDALIGAGAVGRVYRAHQLGVERNVALKIMHRDLAANDGLRARFQREARIAGSLSHPNLVSVLSLSEFEQDGLSVPFLALEYLDGLTLRSALLAQGAMPAARAVHILLQIADALGEAHEHGIVHRDLKPENSMLVRRGDDPDFVKVLDFGVARADAQEYPPIATRAGAIFGSARYVAPECAAGGPCTPASDVYALATLGYECLCGSSPFDGESAIQVLIKQQSAPIPPLAQRAPDVPAALAQLIEKNLAKSPRDRAENARHFFRDLLVAAEPTLAPALTRTRLGHVLSNVPVPVPDLPLPPARAPQKPRATSPTLIVLLCFLLGITAALGIAQQLGAFNSSSKAGPP
ncbi:MAG TPA: serine/threonine-protein kinase [Polyangiaceae bacterium]|nr:serine/threonine-protein kinase [Polyangiaceae bacterium]